MISWIKRCAIEGEDRIRSSAHVRGLVSTWKSLRVSLSHPRDDRAAARTVRDLCAAARLAAGDAAERRAMERMRSYLDRLDPYAIDWTEFVPGVETPRLGRTVLMKPWVGDREKGVLYVSFESEWAKLLYRHCCREVAERYWVVLSPSSSPHNLVNYVFPRAFPGPVVSLISNQKDLEILPRIAPNLRAVPLYASHWVHPGLYQPRPRAGRDVDLVMVANFAKVKRHHALFRAIRNLPAHLRILLIGQGQDGCTAETLRAAARCYGVEGRFELVTDAPYSEVVRALCRSRVSLILSRREGSCLVVAESLFADTPAAILEHAELGSRAFINAATGRFLREEDLAGQLLDFLDHAGDYSPRRWAENHIDCFRSSRVLNDYLKELALAQGQEWTRDLAPVYRCPDPRLACPEDERDLRPAVRDFEHRFGLALGPQGVA